mmetsp:Transcript_29696/g.47840  ORF Transcript_29696/g.47840 Transcript_29696/m.47840 type:complete len:104 (-) Transcript_29696:426-737(-)
MIPSSSMNGYKIAEGSVPKPNIKAESVWQMPYIIGISAKFATYIDTQTTQKSFNTKNRLYASQIVMQPTPQQARKNAHGNARLAKLCNMPGKGKKSTMSTKTL